MPRLAQFAAWQFYAGSGRWAAAQQDAQPVQPAGEGPAVASGFSVIKAGARYWLIQADPVAGSNEIDAYPAAAPWGPFDPAGTHRPGLRGEVQVVEDVQISRVAATVVEVRGAEERAVGHGPEAVKA